MNQSIKLRNADIDILHSLVGRLGIKRQIVIKVHFSGGRARDKVEFFKVVKRFSCQPLKF